MISTFAQARTRILSLLDDDTGARFTDAVVLPGLQEAVDALYSAFLLYQIPKAKVVTTYTLPANTTVLTPATAGITNMGELIRMEERTSGSSEKYREVWEVEDLDQMDPVDILKEFEWRGDAFYFIGATKARQLRISYFTTADMPADFTGTSGVDGSLTFLSKYAAGVIGPRKGLDELADRYMQDAVGPRFNAGTPGGELYRLCMPMVRALQRVQMAPRAFSAGRRFVGRRTVPYVVAQPIGTGGASAPIIYSTTAGTVMGDMNSVNDTFYIPNFAQQITVARNGSTLTQDADYTFIAGDNKFVFLNVLPDAGDIIRAEAYTGAYSGSVQSHTPSVYSVIATALQTDFHPPFTVLPSASSVYLDGQLMNEGPGYDYQVVTGYVVFNVGVTVGSWVRIEV